jgi:glucan phosphoethanolaminetransferase (alkaline phosphatase superfamily)
MGHQLTIDMAVSAAPFILYTAILLKLLLVWRRIFKISDKRRESRLAAILLLMTVCTLTFMIANAYVLQVYGKTLMSVRVFQMFVLSNCLVYWLTLDLITKAASENDASVD